MHAARNAALSAAVLTHSIHCSISPTTNQHSNMSSALPCTQANWAFYMSLSIFRLAAILAGVGARAAQGNASSAIAAQVRDRSSAILGSTVATRRS